MFDMRGVTHPAKTVEAALALSRAGHSDYEVARKLDLPRSTVCNWRVTGPPTRRTPAPVLRPSDELAYSYLLGMYLGDGCLARHPRTYGLVLTLDARYPGVIDECEEAMALSLLAPVHRRVRGDGAMRLASYSQDWPNLFPQHGPGKKHLRRIKLAAWQLGITRRCPKQFLRGLVHSDGSRCINRFSVKLPSGRVREYAYPRYFFTNYSKDIRRIFCDHCELLGIRWTQSNARNISIAHRDSVALLDSFVGPKS